MSRIYRVMLCCLLFFSKTFHPLHMRFIKKKSSVFYSTACINGNRGTAFIGGMTQNLSVIIEVYFPYICKHRSYLQWLTNVSKGYIAIVTDKHLTSMLASFNLCFWRIRFITNIQTSSGREATMDYKFLSLNSKYFVLPLLFHIRPFGNTSRLVLGLTQLLAETPFRVQSLQTVKLTTHLR
jgi:hypothetical protein